MKKLKVMMITLMMCLLTIMSVGQEIKYNELSRESKGTYTSYVASDGATYKIGDKIKIGVPSSNKTFAFITEGDGVFIPMKNLSINMSGTETEIKNIWVVGSKRIGYYVCLRTKALSFLSVYTIQFENALSTKEIRGFGKTSDEALSELKNAKDKLDLGLITQEEFELKKLELSKFIK